MAFCPQCGAQVDAGAKFCPSCGSPLAAPMQPTQPAQPERPANQPSYQQDFYQQKQQRQQMQQDFPYQERPPQPQHAPSGVGDPKYQTLGGWLLFFVICWGLSALSGIGTVIQALGTLGQVMSYAPRFASVSLFTVAVGVLEIAVSTIMIVFIVQRNHQFLRLYQILSIVEIGASVVSGLVTGPITSEFGVSGTVTAGAGVVGGIVGVCLMTLYFCKSVRVRTYMGSAEYLERALFRLGAN